MMRMSRALLTAIIDVSNMAVRFEILNCPVTGAVAAGYIPNLPLVKRCSNQPSWPMWPSGHERSV